MYKAVIRICRSNLLKSYFNLFCRYTRRLFAQSEVELPLSELFPPDYHPFQVNDDDAMTRLAESIKENGVREPGLARPREDGGYELLCGNRRKRACELANVNSMPVIVRELNDDQAVIVMVDSNLFNRERILPSEKAWAYRVKMEALNHNGVKGECHSYEVMVEQTGESKNQIFRLVRLTELITDLIDKVDARQLAFNPAVELSYLSIKEQTAVAERMDAYQMKPSLSQAARLKKLSQSGEFTRHKLESILTEQKKRTDAERVDPARFKGYFPKNYTPRDMELVIIKLLSAWSAEQVSKRV
ncbi:hypothetical protein FACS189425_03040 [Clostridia bacterium]|nr:hypothetical protein FACS189425_03040 [Clostridia bacterium]